MLFWQSDKPKNKLLEVCFKHYKIIKEIGRGGMGVVYKVEDLTLDRIVALKTLLKKDCSNKVDKRFLLEARATASLNHPMTIV